MGGEEEIYHQEEGMEKKGGMKDEWVIMGGFDSSEDSVNSTASSSSSSSSSDMMEDATSSSASSFSPTSGDEGPLFGLSELMAQLPIKRGLSKYYQGKSQTFASLESVKSLEDLAKRVRPKRRKMVGSSKSCEGRLDKHRVYSPEATISKKSSRVSFVTSKGEKGTTLYYFNSCGTCREEPLNV